MRSTVGNVGSNSAHLQSGFRRRIGIGAFVSAAIFAASAQTALAGAEFKLSDDATLNLGLGLRTSFTSLERGAANGSSSSNDFSAESTRIYMSGTFGKYVKATMNFDRQGGASATATAQMIDGIAQFELSEGFNVWMGRMLPPSDRANLAGPYYTSAWAYPGIASNGPSIAAGRDDGGMIWGNLLESKLAYSVGLFNGHNRGNNGATPPVLNSNSSNKLMSAARVQYSFWDAETGYYRNSTYLGGKDLLTIGGSIQSQDNGTGTSASPGTLKISNLDFLLEKKLDSGMVPTLEGGYYVYSLQKRDSGSGTNAGGLEGGKSKLITAALLFPQQVGWGKFQPFVRYQKFDRTAMSAAPNTTNSGTDYGINYLIKGFNAKVSAVYSKLEDTSSAAALQKRDQFVLGVQLQY